jgi:hypothetical protein
MKHIGRGTQNLTGILVLAIALQAPGQDQKKEVVEVKATGCVRKGVEAGCLLLKTLDGKATYNIIASPHPDPGTVVTIIGKPHKGPTVCMQGVPIEVTDWEETGETCKQ